MVALRIDQRGPRVGRTGTRHWVTSAAVAAVLWATPASVAPVSARVVAPVAEAPGPELAPRLPTLLRPGRMFPWFGRSELRPLISRRLKLVLEYRPIAYC